MILAPALQEVKADPFGASNIYRNLWIVTKKSVQSRRRSKAWGMVFRQIRGRKFNCNGMWRHVVTEKKKETLDVSWLTCQQSKLAEISHGEDLQLIADV